MSEIK